MAGPAEFAAADVPDDEWDALFTGGDAADLQQQVAPAQADQWDVFSATPQASSIPPPKTSAIDQLAFPPTQPQNFFAPQNQNSRPGFDISTVPSSSFATGPHTGVPSTPQYVPPQQQNPFPMHVPPAAQAIQPPNVFRQMAPAQNMAPQQPRGHQANMAFRAAAQNVWNHE